MALIKLVNFKSFLFQKDVSECLCRRGPDASSRYDVQGVPGYKVHFVGSVLWMQGRQLFGQPAIDNKGNVLLWNGDIFGGKLVRIDSKVVRHRAEEISWKAIQLLFQSGNTETSDTKVLLDALGEEVPILQVMCTVRGPYSFIYWNNTSKRLWFGRDRIGRHSLLWQINTLSSMLALTSVAKKSRPEFQEVPACGIFCAHLDENNGTYLFLSELNFCLDSIHLHPWSDITEDEISSFKKESFELIISPIKIQSPVFLPDAGLFLTGPTTDDLSPFTQVEHPSSSHMKLLEDLLKDRALSSRVHDLISILKKAVKVRVKTQLDACQSCATICNAHNRSTGCKEGMGWNKFGGDLEVKSSVWVFKSEVHSPTEINAKIQYFNSTDQVSADMNSVHIEDEGTKRVCQHCKTAVLFSGGLDSAILAALAHEFVPSGEPIDLLNVAFERPRPHREMSRKERKQGNKQRADKFDDVPDRKTGRQTWAELRQLHPERNWNFVEIDVSQEELCLERSRRISDLIHPLNTILDDSLGCALWFASRGEGTLVLPSGDNSGYISPARVNISLEDSLPMTLFLTLAQVVLLGMGADEQLGGYMRHRTTLGQRGWQALLAELRHDLARISTRNLGRDDRILSDHGRQGRFPYLDEGVISYVGALPPWHRCCPIPSLPPGVGDKTLLRLAATKLGLYKAACLPKRAFQFGSRIANSKEKASDVSDRL
uniref:Asparagine synthetase domain-containing protein 1 n=1 Tax=Timema tahoe TaxID=61484 RepID=A0A7R9IKF1_9NEOP|nr:unnamed protein product [Timema tahoe]